MELVWTALGICAVVVFVFYVLAQYWQRLLTQHTRAIRDLEERVEALEAMDDPALRKRLSDSVPSPLEQVITFGFRLEDKFWSETLQASSEETAYVKAHGKFLGSVKIERWRSHSVVTVFELLPQRNSAEWNSRSIDVYSGNDSPKEAVSLWEIPLAPNAEYAPEPAPALQLLLIENALELRVSHGRFASIPGSGNGAWRDESIFLHIPLVASKLSEYRREEADEPEGADGTPPTMSTSRRGDSWISYFYHRDEQLGVDWQLCIRDLSKKEEWERWKVWEPWSAA